MSIIITLILQRRKLRSKEITDLLRVKVRKQWDKDLSLKGPVNDYTELPFEKYLNNQTARQQVKSTPWVI